MTKLQTLKGFRDFLPAEKRQRDWLLKVIIEVFERFGFEPLETPTLEYASLLLGKYGTEADKLVYTFKDKGGREVALRYDQTVPTARVLTQYQSQLPKYFRRYQIQNVFRAEKPQQGRFREFTQCDIDIFGSTHPLADAEILACTYFTFKHIGYPTVKLKINDRTTLFAALDQFATPSVTVLSIIQTIDKMEKLGEDKVVSELVSKGLLPQQAKSAVESIKTTRQSPNLSDIMSLAHRSGVPQSDLIFSPSLARGLDYYTGMIFEVSVPEYSGGSLGGGGRYDHLIKNLGGIDIPAVGIAFGFDRMVEAARDLRLTTDESLGTTVLVTVFDRELLQSSLTITFQLRNSGIGAEVYVNPEDPLDKQLKYADRKGIPYVVIVGPEEAKQGKVQLKNMKSKTQEMLTIEELITKLGY